ncbi:DUF3180 domain-containing protein [Kutzneria kofuensis]|uniref:Xanthosine utilization system XapX-like protein n=1 Tax=Kutzneria kofuensis TaxID=103725 RepID=A0A7W9KHF5_9PSEU|nr:DUF3180 domain-containing protein [Kutzneria kofuensis]MBB5892293.1 xanthosine utilization system XapX-like protein [Kutzneria kofuensis]
MKFTRIRDLVAVALVAGLLTAIVLRLVYADLPTLPRLAGVTFGVLAIVEAILAWQLRNRIAGKPGVRPVQPLTAARAVALAKASSLVGALMAGVWAGVLLTVLPLLAVSSAANEDRTTALVGLVGSAALVAAALWLEHCCKTPDPPQQDDSVGLR